MRSLRNTRMNHWKAGDSGDFKPNPTASEARARYRISAWDESSHNELPSSTHDQVMEEEGAAWELLYNLGTALLQRNGSVGAAEVEFEVETAETCLEQAEETCLEVRRFVTM